MKMPLYWTIDSKAALVTVTAEGEVTRADADAYLDAIEGGGAIAYRKLFDGSAGRLSMDQQELMALARASGVIITCRSARSPS